MEGDLQVHPVVDHLAQQVKVHLFFFYVKIQHNYFFKTKTGAGRIGTARNGTAGGRPITGMADGVNRPMTGIRGAGFPGTASGSRTGGK